MCLIAYTLIHKKYQENLRTDNLSLDNWHD